MKTLPHPPPPAGGPASRGPAVSRPAWLLLAEAVAQQTGLCPLWGLLADSALDAGLLEPLEWAAALTLQETP